MDKEKEYPKTIDEAVERLLKELSDKDKAEIAAMKKEDLIDLHFGLGRYIRNNFGLYDGDDALKTDWSEHDDSCSSRIIDALWERLKT